MRLLCILLIMNNVYDYGTPKPYPQGVWGGEGGIIFLGTGVLKGQTWAGGFTGVEAAHGIIVRCFEVIFGKG
jgi:hypothetical protein